MTDQRIDYTEWSAPVGWRVTNATAYQWRASCLDLPISAFELLDRRLVKQIIKTPA